MRGKEEESQGYKRTLEKDLRRGQIEDKEIAEQTRARRINFPFIDGEKYMASQSIVKRLDEMFELSLELSGELRLDVLNESSINAYSRSLQSISAEIFEHISCIENLKYDQTGPW